MAGKELSMPNDSFRFPLNEFH